MRGEHPQRPACAALTEMWNTAVAQFLAGGPSVPLGLEDWHSSYRGSGSGRVQEDALPEPFLGSLVRPRAVFLALNPGKADLRFHGRDGVFADQISTAGSYSAWAASWPYLNEPWLGEKGKNRHHATRLGFLRNWLDEPNAPCDAMVAFELYPWHSAIVNRAMRPEPGFISRFVLQPIAELGVPVFAFGAPWFPILERLPGLRVAARLGFEGQNYGSAVPSRTVMVLTDDRGLIIVAEKHNGSACPPSPRETVLLRLALERFAALPTGSSA
jgi:hypothetical protein